MKNDYASRQAAWIEKYNITIGSKVRVVRAAENKENGWDAMWAKHKNDYIGTVFNVRHISARDGLYDSIGWAFPYFVLEPVTEPATPLTDGNAPASEMTKREVMAMANLQGLLANTNLNEMTGNAVKDAVLLADELIAELNKTEQK